VSGAVVLARASGKLPRSTRDCASWAQEAVHTACDLVRALGKMVLAAYGRRD